MKLLIDGQKIMNSYLATTPATLNDLAAQESEFHAQGMESLSMHMSSISEFAQVATTPLLNAYFFSELRDIKNAENGGFAKKEGVSGFKVFTDFLEKLNPILKQTLDFDLVDVPLRN